MKKETAQPHPWPRDLTSVWHYRQALGTQPVPRTITLGTEYIELMTSGRGWVRDGGKWHEVLPGDLVWNCPGDETIGRSDPARPYNCLAAVFRVKEAKGRRVRRFSIWSDLQEAKKFADETVRHFHDPGFDRRVLKDYMYATLIFRVRQHENLMEVERLPEGIRAALERIERDYARRLTIRALARLAGYSPPHLHDLFRQHLNTTPHRVIVERRLRAAKELLAGTTKSIKEIAGACGFADSPAFVHAFKKNTGMTPASFRLHYLSAASGERKNAKKRARRIKPVQGRRARRAASRA